MSGDNVLESVTRASIVDGALPPNVTDLLSRPGVWERRTAGNAPPGRVGGGS